MCKIKSTDCKIVYKIYSENRPKLIKKTTVSIEQLLFSDNNEEKFNKTVFCIY